jgi:hypothetical protein
MTELPTASEIVFVHALRFVEPSTRGVPVPGQRARVNAISLGRMLVRAAVVAAHREEWVVLRRARSHALMGLVSRHPLVALVGPNAHGAPAATLEGDIVAAAATSSDVTPVQLVWILRHALHPPGGPRPDPIELVRRSALDRGILLEGDRPAEIEGLGNDAADRVQSILADLRERDPVLWVAVCRAVDVALLGWMPKALLRSTERALPVDGREPRQVDIGSWERLNRNPPSANR